MDAGHDWQDFGDAEWCALCGAIRVTKYIEGQGDVTQLYFPYAYQKVSKTTCAKAREMRDAKAQ